MMPTLNPSMDAVLVDATPNWTAQYGINDYNIGDVVIFRDPNDRHQSMAILETVFLHVLYVFCIS